MESNALGPRVDEAPTVQPRASAVETPPAPVKRFGDYELLAEIARGGMGIVYKARQVSLNRIVALKMILAGKFAGTEEVQRFRVEARAAANLRHPNVVAIYEVDEHDGQHFFSMEYVAGTSLARRLQGGVMPSRLAAHYVVQIARAVQYAHERGILHRDLKPANVLLDEEDVPKVTDFGLAKLLPCHDGADTAPQLLYEAGHLTRTGAVLGTPSYLAPEQAAGPSVDLGPPCDVYGIGAILYELVTGRPPFKAESSLETILQVLNQDPVPPRVLNRNVDPDVETICMKCLEKNPALRYATARELADDLQRYLDGDPITARSVNLLERLTRSLAHSQHDKELRAWGTGLMIFAAIIFLSHAASTLFLLEGDPENLALWIPRVAQFALLLLVLAYFRSHALLPTNAAERLIWAAWIGYLLAYASASGVMFMLGHDRREIYPVSTVLSGMAFFVMGCHVWGGCYVIGIGFMVMAPLMAWHDNHDWAPLWFGTLWGIALATIGARYLRMLPRAPDP